MSKDKMVEMLMEWANKNQASWDEAKRNYLTWYEFKDFALRWKEFEARNYEHADANSGRHRPGNVLGEQRPHH